MRANLHPGLLLAVVSLVFAHHAAAQQVSYNWKASHPYGVIHTRFMPPAGYNRLPYPDSSFATWVRWLPVKLAQTPVRLYNGELKANQNAHAAVLDIDVGTRDLQQCADAVIRLRAEYLYTTRKLNDIQFHFTNGFLFDYKTWAAGRRVKVEGNKTRWVEGAAADSSYTNLKSYLIMAFSYCGSLSLSKELKPVSVSEIMPGDVFIQGGSPGHAVIVVDVVENIDGKKMFLLAQSYMPAQDIHVLRNPSGNSAWYPEDFGEYLETPEWRFRRSDLKRF